MSKDLLKDNPIPDDFWNELSEEEKDALTKAQADEIGPRVWKSYHNKFLPLQMMVIPAGRQHDGDKVVQMFHIIVEDMEGGECNGEYSLISETELLDKYNLTFNNK